MQNYETLFTDGYLKDVFGDEFDIDCATDDAAVLERLQRWAKRDALKETSDEHGFIGTFFESLRGYRPNGHADPETVQVVCEFKDVRSGVAISCATRSASSTG